MNNYDAILKMTPKQMRTFLDHVYLTGMNNGLYMARLDDEEADEFDPECYTLGWLFSPAEDATSKVFAEDGDAYLPQALTEAIFRNAGIDPSEEEEPEVVTSCGGIKVVIGASVKIREAEEINLDGLTREELEDLLEELQGILDDLEDEEPEDDTEEHESWEEKVDQLEDYISQVEDAIDSCEDE